jgi:molecular chaperone GrpE
VTQEPRGGESQETAAPHPAHQLEDISGVDNWVEEGGPLEPQDLDPDRGFGDAAAEMANEPEVEEDPVERQLAERTADLQRLQAEYVNYKRRVDRDRELVRQNATYGVLSSLLPVLDDIDRAREHGELEGGFKAVADSLDRIVSGLGLTKFGAPGEPFDPNVHEALAHGHSPDVTETVVEHLAQAGYRIGDRVVRAAKVTVLDPEA